MKDKNGTEIKMGDVVRISGSDSKNRNGLYYVDRAPETPGWNCDRLSLKKITRNGKISTSKYSTAEWPLFVPSRGSFDQKAAERKEWNRLHAKIEIVKNVPTTAIKNTFLDESYGFRDRAEWLEYNYGEDHAETIEMKNRAKYYRELAFSIV